MNDLNSIGDKFMSRAGVPCPFFIFPMNEDSNEGSTIVKNIYGRNLQRNQVCCIMCFYVLLSKCV